MKRSQLRLIAGTAAMLLTGVSAAHAQNEAPSVSVAGGYSYSRDFGAKQDLSQGFFVSASYRFMPGIALAGEVGRGTASYTFPVESSTASVTTEIQVFMIGGQYSIAAHGLRLKGRVLGGVAREKGAVPIFRLSVAAPETKPLVQAGGGIELPLQRHLSIETSLDYRRIFSDSYQTNNEIRFAVGLAVGFGPH